jgi:hypothetical protein
MYDVKQLKFYKIVIIRCPYDMYAALLGEHNLSSWIVPRCVRDWYINLLN